VAFGSRRPGIGRRTGQPTRCCRLDGVRMNGHFRHEERHALLAAGFAQVAKTETRTLASLQRGLPLEIWQSKVALAVTTVGGAEKRKQGRILADGQQLPVALSPAVWSKVSGKNPDFSDKWIGQGVASPLLILTGEYPLKCDDEIQHQIRRHVFMWLTAAGGQYAGRVHQSVSRGAIGVGIAAAP